MCFTGCLLLEPLEAVLASFRPPNNNNNDNDNDNVHDIRLILCSMKILREFYFADLGFFVVCGNKFLRLEMTEISSGN